MTPLDDLLAAVDAYYESGLSGAPDQDGIPARLLCGARLRLAADKCGQWRKEERMRQERASVEDETEAELH
jgi:hypothetical protein